MKSKHIIILAVLLVILLGAVYIKRVLVKPEIEMSEYKSLEIFLEPAQVFAIEIKKAKDGGNIRLEKKDDGEWHIPSHWKMKANREAIEKFIKDISELEGELRSSTEQLFSDYGLSDEEAFSITLFGKEGDIMEQLVIGTERPDVNTTFLRIKDSKDVYLVDKDIFELIGIYSQPEDAELKADKWIDLSVGDLDIGEIESLKITKFKDDEKIVTVDIKKELDKEKNLKQWVASGGALFDLDAEKIKNYFRRINNLSPYKAMNPKGEGYGFEVPFLSIILKCKEEPIELVFGAKTDENKKDRYLKTWEGYVYAASESWINHMDINISTFFVDNPLRIDKDKLKALIITSGEKTITLDKKLIEQNTDYINGLKEFSIEAMLFEKKYAKGLNPPINYSLKIEQEGQDMILDVEKEEENRFIAKLQERPGVFTISKNTFQKIFEELNKLNLKAEEKN